MKTPSKTKLYTIQWIVNGVVKEELNINNPRPIAVTYWWIKKLEATSHKTGKLVPKEVL